MSTCYYAREEGGRFGLWLSFLAYPSPLCSTGMEVRWYNLLEGPNYPEFLYL